MMKPLSPDIHWSLAEWVRAGGCLIYVGDGGDPFHAVRSWWRDAGYAHPAQHLFSLLDLPKEPESGELYFSRTLAEHERAVNAYRSSWEQYDQSRGIE